MRGKKVEGRRAMLMEGALVEKAACEILISPIAPQCDSSDNEGNFKSGPKKSVRKRKRESMSEAYSVKGNYKVCPLPWAIGFSSAKTSESESNDDLADTSGTLIVVKGYESAVTTVVTDSEDDLFFLEEAVEFEPPGSDSEEEEEEDEDEDIISLLTSEDEDPGADGGDEDEGDEDSDSEFDDEDQWMCLKCNLNNHPMSRQCARCWSERQEWLPHLKRISSAPVVELSRITNAPSSPTLQKSTSLAVPPTIENPSSLSSLTVTAAPNLSSTPSAPLQPKKTAVEPSDAIDTDSPFEPDMCVICLTQPRNASLVHGRTGHQVCCIGCAEKLKEGRKKCPVCRKKIQLVVKNFF